jgi:toxin-antitoxin system PIN domain toxin
LRSQSGNAWLPDVNFWVALTADQHEHHELAADWFAGITDRLFFCRVTLMGLFRLLTNNKVMADEVLNPTAAISVYLDLLEDDRIEFAQEPAGVEVVWTDLMRGASANSSSWTDAYLAAIALKSGLTMVSFDKGLKRWPMLRLKLLPSFAN